MPEVDGPSDQTGGVRAGLLVRKGGRTTLAGRAAPSSDFGDDPLEVGRPEPAVVVATVIVVSNVGELLEYHWPLLAEDGGPAWPPASSKSSMGPSGGTDGGNRSSKMPGIRGTDTWTDLR